MKAEELTMEFVKERLLDCYSKRKTNVVGKMHEGPTAMVAHNKKKIVCYICGKSGHYQNDCPDNRRSRNDCPTS